MQLVQGLIEAVDSTCVTFAIGVANLKVDVSKIHFFQKLIFKDTTRKTSAHMGMFFPPHTSKEVIHIELIQHIHYLTELIAVRRSLVGVFRATIVGGSDLHS